MENTPEQVAMIGDDVSNDLGGGAKELGLHRFLGKFFFFRFMQKKKSFWHFYYSANRKIP